MMNRPMDPRMIFFILVYMLCTNPGQAQLVCLDKTTLVEHARVHLHGVKERQDFLDLSWGGYIEGHAVSASMPGAAVLHTLPVVFHIVTQNGTGISDTRIQTGLDWLNQSFANEGYFDPSTGVDVEIRFCLAQRDPAGWPTTGINRITSPLGDMVMENDDKAVKDLVRWRPTDYINIWVVEEIGSLSSGPGVAGYAYFPSVHGSDIDGIVVEARFLGVAEKENCVLTHEMGHYMGLYHTFEGGCKNDDCARDGDLICDTPPDQSTAYATCTEGMNTCDSDTDSGFSTDQKDMISNYMDYSRLECYHQFTSGQRERMRYSLEGIRQSLLQSQGCQGPCNDNISVRIDVAATNVLVCDTMDLKSDATGAIMFEWYIDDQKVSTQKDTSFAFENPGIYTVIVVAKNSDGTCVDSDTMDIHVSCAFEVTMTETIPGCVPANSQVSLAIHTVQDASVAWYVDGRLSSNTEVLRTSYNAGVYEIKVVVADSKCKDSLVFPLLVGCQEICDNGFDDDLDGLYDCFDPDCCADCGDFYYKACADAYVQCRKPQSFSIKEKWATQKEKYLSVFTMLSGDIDGDGETEMLAWDFGRRLVVVDKYGNKEHVIPIDPTKAVNWVNPLTMADIDRDGDAEIYCLDKDGRVVCYDHDGTKRFESDVLIAPFGIFQYCPLQVVDINLDGRPEVTVAYNILDAMTGQILYRSTDNPQWVIPIFSQHYVLADILEDGACADCKGLELVNGPQVISFSDDFTRSTVEVQLPSPKSGIGVVVDWDLDGDLDVVGSLDSPSRIVVWEGQNSSILWSKTFNYSYLGVPVVSNLDGDAEPELVVLAPNQLVLFSLDNNLDKVWETPLVQTSDVNPICFDFHNDGKNEVVIRDGENLLILNGQDGSPMFRKQCFAITNDERVLISDIDDDGHAELVTLCQESQTTSFADIFVFEGDQVKWPNTRNVVYSYTNYQMGIHDDLTIPVYAQQHHLLNNGLQDMNSQITQIIIPDLQDTLELFAEIARVHCVGDSLLVAFQLCSSGGSTAPQIEVSVYSGDPSLAGTTRLQVFSVVTGGLGENECLELKYNRAFEDLNGSERICLIINDDGTRPLPFDYTDGQGYGGLGECDYLNNIVCFDVPDDEAKLKPIQDQTFCGNGFEVVAPGNWAGYLWSTGDTTASIAIEHEGLYWLEVRGGCGGTDRDTFEVIQLSNSELMLPDTFKMCAGGVVPIHAGSGFDSYKWQDGREDSIYTAFFEGRYWVEVIDACGNVWRDTTYVQLLKLDDLGLPDTLQICAGDSIRLSIDGRLKGFWEPAQDMNCTQCEEVSILPTRQGHYYVHAVNDQGCGRSDSVYIYLQSEMTLNDTGYTCPGLPFVYGDTLLGVGEHHFLLPNALGCDTILQVSILSGGIDTIEEIRPICFMDSLFFRGEYYHPGDYEIYLSSGTGCDTFYILHVLEQPEIDVTIETTGSCLGDTAGTVQVTPIFAGMYIFNFNDGNNQGGGYATGFEPGEYAVIVIDILNCTERFTFTIDTLDATMIADTQTVCQGDSVYFRGSYYQKGSYPLVFPGNMECDTQYSLIIQEGLAQEVQLELQHACPGENTGSAQVTGRDLTGWRFQWTDGQDLGNGRVTGLGIGTHGVIITDEEGCKQILEFEIEEVVLPEYELTITGDSCSQEGDFTIILEGAVEGHLRIGDVIQVGRRFEGLRTGEYTLSILDSNGCTVLDTILIFESLSEYEFGLVSPIQINIGDTAYTRIFGDTGDIDRVEWKEEAGLLCDDCGYLLANPLYNTEYTVWVTDVHGCVHELVVWVLVDNDVDIYAPNIFSPNGDNINDVWKVYASDENVEILSLEIYSRWGELVYREGGVLVGDVQGWRGDFNGEILNPNVFVYRIEYRIPGLSSEHKVGSVSLIR